MEFPAGKWDPGQHSPFPLTPRTSLGALVAPKLGHSWKAAGEQAEMQPRERGKDLGPMEDLGMLVVLSRKDNVEMELHNPQDNNCHLRCPAALLSQAWDTVQTC